MLNADISGSHYSESPEDNSFHTVLTSERVINYMLCLCESQWFRLAYNQLWERSN